MPEYIKSCLINGDLRPKKCVSDIYLESCEELIQTCVGIQANSVIGFRRLLERIGPFGSFDFVGFTGYKSETFNWRSVHRISNMPISPEAFWNGQSFDLVCPSNPNRRRTIGRGNEFYTPGYDLLGPFAYFNNITIAGETFTNVSVAENNFIVDVNYGWHGERTDTPNYSFFAATCCPWGESADCPGGPLPEIIIPWSEYWSEEVPATNVVMCVDDACVNEVNSRSNQYDYTQVAVASFKLVTIIDGIATPNLTAAEIQFDSVPTRLIAQIGIVSWSGYEGNFPNGRRDADPAAYLERHKRRYNSATHVLICPRNGSALPLSHPSLLYTETQPNDDSTGPCFNGTYRTTTDIDYNNIMSATYFDI